MRVALLTTFAAGKKEPLAELVERVHAAFASSGQGEPVVRFTFADAPVPGMLSAVDRVLKRHPELERFVAAVTMLPNSSPIKQITNGPSSPAAGESVAFATLLAIAQGVPRSFPIHSLVMQLHGAAFGDPTQRVSLAGHVLPGVIVTDSWWVSGRKRSLSALTIVDADAAAKKLPELPDPVKAVLAVCGKAKSTTQVPLADSSEPASVVRAASPEVMEAVAAVVRDYRSRLAEILERAAMPHDLPPALEAMQSTPFGATTGPKKPVLLRAFKPMGYDCRAGSGTFTLRRRTPSNLTVEIDMDVGTWSRSLTTSFAVKGVGFAARLALPVSPRAIGGHQYPIGDADRWQQIVTNLAALVTELERTFVPAIEKAAGPAPEWYKPES